MKINVYYGGRGLLDDPTLYVLNKMEDVLRELRVNVTRYNIYEHKHEIATLPQTFKDADGIILATTIEWLGIGGYMQQFLDACWLYGDKEKIGTVYMQPIVMSTTYGEREGELDIRKAWEILGGLPCEGLCGYVEDLVSFEMNPGYTEIIEKKAENLYRTISQKMKSLPCSSQAVRQSVLRTQELNLTPQESEQLSQYVSDDTYVKQQKEDIEELASMFKGMLAQGAASGVASYVDDFKRRFVAQDGATATYSIEIEGQKDEIYIAISNGELRISSGVHRDADVAIKTTDSIMEDLMAGRMSFQRAFMTGEITAKGDFKVIRMLDQMFAFAE